MKKQISRRGFGGALGAAALAGATLGPRPVKSPPAAAPAAFYHFPERLHLGMRHCVLPGRRSRGRGWTKPSVWDTFPHTPGKVQNGDTGDVAYDSYHRYKEDVRLLKSLGVKAYRFSVAWPRIIPDGTGPLNEKEIVHYERLLDELAAAGIEPMPHLFQVASSPGSRRPLRRLAISADIQGVRGLHRVDCHALLRPSHIVRSLHEDKTEDALDSISRPQGNNGSP